MSTACVAAVEYYLPDSSSTDAALDQEFPDWNIAKISAKTGIRNRQVAHESEFTSDFCIRAALLLFERHSISPFCIDYIIVPPMRTES